VYYPRDGAHIAVSAAEQAGGQSSSDISDKAVENSVPAEVTIPESCAGRSGPVHRTSTAGDFVAKKADTVTRRIRVLYQYPPTMRAFCSDAVPQNKTYKTKPAAPTNTQNSSNVELHTGNSYTNSTTVSTTVSATTEPHPLLVSSAQQEQPDSTLTPLHTPEENEEKEPTFRSLGRMHNDAEYAHQPGEVNFWLPLSECNPENSMWLESAPGRADWRPILLSPGGLPSLSHSGSGSLQSEPGVGKCEDSSEDQVDVLGNTLPELEAELGLHPGAMAMMREEDTETVEEILKSSSRNAKPNTQYNVIDGGETAELLRFHGTLCRHFTRANSSGKTRVSMDFRCCVEDSFDPDWRMSTSNHAHERRYMDYDVVFNLSG
jgi:hypothetical protein